MPTLQDIIDDVTDEFRRPDLATQIARHARNSIVRLHHLEFFKNDLRTSATISYTPPTNTGPVVVPDVEALCERLRSINNFLSIDPNTGLIIERICEVDGEDAIWDSYGQVKRPTFYRVGNTAYVYPAVPSGLLAIRFYQNPSFDPLSSWILDKYYDGAILWITRAVAQRIGHKEIADGLQEPVASFVRQLITSHLFAHVE